MLNRAIRVLIVDDHVQVRRALSVVLEMWDDFQLVGEAENGQEALVQVEQLQPDVVLMDLVMPVMDGVTATRAICQKFPDVRVIALTSAIEYELRNQVVEAGAQHCLLKSVSVDEIAQTIRAAVE